MMLSAWKQKIEQSRFIDLFVSSTLTHSVVAEISLTSCFMASKRANYDLTPSAAIKFGVIKEIKMSNNVCFRCKANLTIKYCPYCGVLLEGAASHQVVEPTHQAVSRDAQPATSNRGWIVGSIVFGIIVMLLSAVYTPQSYTVLFTRAQQDAWLMTTAIVLTVLYFPLSYLQGALVGEGSPSWPKFTIKWVLCNLIAWVAWVIITGLGYLTSVMLILTHVLLGYTMSTIFIGYPIFLAMIVILYTASVAIPVGFRQFAD